MKLKPGHGYWDITNYPIGGNFKRVGKDGKMINIVFKQLDPKLNRSCDAEVIFLDGTRGAVKMVNLEE